MLPTSGASAEALVSFIVDLVKDNQNNRDILTKTLAALELHCARSAGLAETNTVNTLYIEPGSPWENGYNEWFNGKLRDELLNRELFYSLAEARY